MLAWIVIAAIALGYGTGYSLAYTALGEPIRLLSLGPERLLAIFATLLASAFVGYLFRIRTQLASEAAARSDAQRLAAEAQLRLLRAQLDPHMLFNTLANLRSLVDDDPKQAQAMIDQLITYLRSALAASRSESTTLRHEFAQLRAYLEIMALRMGPRLGYTLELPDALQQTAVPTMLLQPLVENAIKHGLEPKIGPGRIEVSARQSADAIEICIADTGLGLPPDEPDAARHFERQLRPAACARTPAGGLRLARLADPCPTRAAGRAGLRENSAMNARATALIAEDEPVLAATLQRLLARIWPELEIVAVAEHGVAAIERALALAPDVMFLDIKMPGRTGLEVAEAVVDDWPEGRPEPLLVFVTAYDEFAVPAFERAAVDYLLKPATPERLLLTVERLQQRLATRAAAPADGTMATLFQRVQAISRRRRADRAHQGDPRRRRQHGADDPGRRGDLLRGHRQVRQRRQQRRRGAGAHEPARAGVAHRHQRLHAGAPQRAGQCEPHRQRDARRERPLQPRAARPGAAAEGQPRLRAPVSADVDFTVGCGRRGA